MKVTIRQEQWDLARPLTTAHGVIDVRRSAVVTVEQDGFVGNGEAAPLPGFGLESYDEAVAQLERWSSGGSPPETPAAAAAMKAAVAQLTARAHHLSLAHFLNASAGSAPVAVQAVVGADTPEEAAQQCGDAVEAGHRAVKVKVGTDQPQADIDRVRACREATPDDVLLRLDANQGWGLATAELVLDAIAALHIDLVEEPTRDAREWAPLAAHGIPLGVDEQFGDPTTAPELLGLEHIEALILKPAVLGGPVTTYRIAEAAQELGKRCIVSSFIDGPVGLRIARDLARAVDPAAIHGVGTAPLLAAPLPLEVTPVGGALHDQPSDIELPREAIAVRRTPTFDQESLPDGLLRAHQIADGTWGVLRVERGDITFVWESPDTPPRRMSIGDHQVIPPRIPHHLEVDGEVRVHIEFHRV